MSLQLVKRLNDLTVSDDLQYPGQIIKVHLPEPKDIEALGMQSKYDEMWAKGLLAQSEEEVKVKSSINENMSISMGGGSLKKSNASLMNRYLSTQGGASSSQLEDVNNISGGSDD